MRSPTANSRHRKHGQPRAEERPGGAPWIPGLPALAPDPVQKAEPALFRPPWERTGCSLCSGQLGGLGGL